MDNFTLVRFIKKACDTAITKTMVLVVLFFISSLAVFAQPSNDNPCNATPLTAGAACNYTNYTTTNATPTVGVPTPGCGNYAGSDVWFSVTVPASGAVSFDSNTGQILDGAMAVYSGTCNSLTLISCDDDASTNGFMPMLTVSNRPPGSTLFVRFWPYGDFDSGTFGLCATAITPLPPTNQDCPDAIPICQDVYSTTSSYVGSGNIPDEIDPFTSCLGAGEDNDVWYTFTVQQSGNLSFLITPNVMTEDYDWAVYNLTNAGCADIATNPALDVSCNFSADPGTTGPDGSTNQNTATPFDPRYNDVVPVIAGETYVVNVSNFSNSQNGYTIDFGPSSAVIYDNIPPQMTAMSANIPCGATQVSVTFSENILCSTLQNGDFTLNGPGGPYTISNVTALGCANGGTYGKIVTFNISPAISTSGNFQICLTNASGSVTDLCGNIAPPSCQPFVIDPITTTTNSTNLNCFGVSTGSATVNPTTGISPYTYAWSPNVGTTATVNNLAAGSYTVTITDAGGCTTSNTIVITEPTQVTAAINTVQPSCGSSNGSATAVPAGGTGPYTYAWSPSGGTGATASNLGSGNFSVTITDSRGCTGSANVNLAAPSAPVAYVSSITSSTCASPTGDITIAVIGGTGPYTYAWSPSGGTGATASNLMPNTYTCVVTDASGCSSSATSTIGVPPTVTATITASTPESCAGTADGTATAVGANGTAAYSYVWSPSGGNAATATGLTAGNYTVVVTDATGCTNSTSVTITSPPIITAALSSTPVQCAGSASGTASVVAGGGNGGFSYSWSPSGGNAVQATGLTAGTYTVTVTDVNGCTTTGSTTLTDPTPVNAVMSSTGSICGQASGSATAAPSGGTGPYTYAWSPVAGSAATLSNVATGNYTVTVTDANGCTVTNSVSVADLPGPVLSLNASTNVNCFGGATGTATVSANGGSAPLSYTWSPAGGSAVTANGLTAGNYTVTVTDANGCTSTTQVAITEPTQLTSTLTASTNPSCNGGTNGSIAINAAGGTPVYSYAWSPAGPNAPTNPSIGPGNYTVTVTDNNGCTTTISSTLTDPPLLTASTSSLPALCNGGATGSASVVGAGGTGAYTYAWTPSGGSGANANGLTAGNYSVTLTDANGCTTTASVSVTEPALLSASISATINVPCNGNNTGSATVSALGGTTNYSYAWSPSGGTGTTANNLAAGNYSVIVTDANGCTANTTTTITQPTLLTSSTSATPVDCNGGANGSVSVTAAGGTANYSYAWNPGNILTQNASGLSAGTYTVTVTDANGCTSTSQAVIAEPTVLSSSTNSTPTLCFGTSDGTANVTSSGGTPAYTYNWFPSGGTTASASGLTAGNYSVTVTDLNGCTSVSTVTVGQPTAISLSTLPTAATCGSANGTATATVSGGAGAFTYAWSPSGGSAAGATGLIAGAYTVTVTDANGCTSSSTANVSNIGGPTINAFSTASVSCFGGNDGTASSSIANGTGPFTYAWSPAGGSASSASNLSAGNYSVSVTDANGCTSVANLVITEPAALSAQASSNPVSCNGDLNGSASVNVAGGTAGYAYSWNPGGAVVMNPTGLAAGNYSVTITDANGCTITASTTITQPTAVTASVTPSPTLCFGSSDGSANVVANGGTAGYTYSWFPSGGNSTNANGLSAGNYTVTITDANGCTNTASTTISQPTAILLSTSSTPSTCGSSNGSASVVANGGAGNYTYSWSPIGGTAANATNIPSNSYTVTVTDVNGCTSSSAAAVSSLGGPTISASLNNDVSCFGGSNGSATASVSSGNGPYTYLWSPSGGAAATASNLSAGNYSVFITDVNGCTSVANVLVTEPTQIAAQASSNPALCNGSATGSTNVIVAGGTSGYTYLWTPGNSGSSNATGLNAGNYTVTVTDANGCTITASTTVNQPTALGATITPTATLCNGSADGSAQANVNGGNPGYSYSWFPSGGGAGTALNLSSGNYTVTITDANGCSTTASTTITQPAAINLSTSSTPATCGSANGSASVVANGGASPYAYTWSPSGGNAATANNLPANTYTVTVTDANGCINSTSESVSNTGGPTISTVVNNNVACFGQNNGSATVNVASGTAPYSYQWQPAGGNGVNATNLAAGNYSITVTDANGCISNDNVVITEPTALALQISSTDANCAGIGGSATILVAGGSTPYSYVWTNSPSVNATANNLTGGNYTVTVSDSHGCTSSMSTTVNQPTSMSATTSTSAVSCHGGSNGSASVSITGGNGALTYSWSPSGGNNSVANNLSAGNYSVTVSDASGCATTSNVVVTEPVAMTLSTSTLPSACGSANGSAQVTAGGGASPYTYSWSPSGGNSQNASNLTAGNYIVTVTDNNGCSSTASALVSNTGGATVTLNALTNVQCNGGSNGSASINVTGGTGPFTYNWSPSGGNAASANNLAAGNYTVTTADANGCQSVFNITITEPSSLTATTSSTPAVCGNANGSATIHAGGGAGNYTYSWTTVAGNDSTASNLVSGNYTVISTDQNGCTLSSTINVGTSGGANAILQNSTNVSCAGGADGTATVSATGGSAPYTYTWSPSGGNAATANGLSAGTYSVVVSDANNCSTTVNVVINDGNIVTLQTSSTPASCNGGTDGSANVVASGGIAPYSYQWTGSASTSSTASNLAIGNYTVVVTDAHGCIESEVATVNSATAIALNPVTTDVNCNGYQNGTASLSPVGGTPPYSYQWTGGVSTSNTATALNGGNYTITVTDQNGCASIANITINEPAPVVLTTTPASTICIGSNVTLTASVQGGQAPITYIWSNANSDSTQIVSPTSTTSYSVTVTDANGCSPAAQTIAITVRPPLTISAYAPAVICDGGSANITSLATGGDGNLTYSWNNGAINTANATVSPTDDSTFTVTVTDGCGTPAAQAQVIILVSPSPQVQFGPGILNGCAPFTVNFDDQSQTTPGSVYTWYFGDQQSSSIQNPSHVYTEPGQYDVGLQITNSDGCSSNLIVNQMITVGETPNANFVSDPTETTLINPDFNFTNLTSGASQYTWDFGDGSDYSADLNPSHSYTDTGTYLVTLIATNQSGCIDTVRGYVEVGTGFTIYIPNAFTPNHDLVNDGFNAYGIGWRDYELFILDRWGLNIYHSLDKEKPWDGTYEANGIQCQSDVYIYKIQVHDTEGKLHSFIGHVSLVR